MLTPLELDSPDEKMDGIDQVQDFEGVKGQF
jgi:hypothetical protein